MIQKVVNKYVVFTSIGISFLLLSISSLFSWDDNPVMGFDKLYADTCIVLCSLLFIRLLGLQEGYRGFFKEGIRKGDGIWKSLLISALIFGAIFIKSKNICSGITIHALVDWCSLFIGNCFIGTESIISMEMTIQQAVVIIILGSVPPILIAWMLLRQRNIQKTL